ncbi:AraC family transcriptional regulator [Novosphingobium sp.]|uniref:AraC family transcriptional regulator n=1 Tax=Novosphingobium sp. TaxID=1874826 RepID=UPI0025D0585E|nr:AraC family transcriptional regulator [Novosphingobium sp.]MCC6927051.1 AraC family transcriptional regulator [Novosphingobium sp.]
MAQLIRAASLSGYLDCMSALGIDPGALLREQALDRQTIAIADRPIPAQAAVRLLERSAAVAGCPTLGLRMAEGRLLANLGSASLLIVHQPTLRHALAALGEFRSRINSTLVLTLSEEAGDAILREDLALAAPEPARQSIELALGVMVRLCRAVLGESWAPRLVCLTAPAPAAADLAVYRRLLCPQMQFDAEFNALVIAAADLDRPGVLADAGMAQHARELLDAVGKGAARSIREQVEGLIFLHLPAGRATIQSCAAVLGLTVRTLQRRLEEEGAAFTTLLERARKQLATQYLANPRLRITDVAAMLGYGSIGAFSRWHAATFGETASKLRKSGKDWSG